jgi:urease accessory protein
VRAGYPDGSGTPEVQITNPSGGTLGGDALETRVSLAPGAAATILTQAANKAYKGPEAVGDALFEVGSGAFLEYLPHHLIPYADSNYRQLTGFRLAEDAAVISWDACAAGRVARGERFAFSRLSSTTRITRAGDPEVLDGFDLRVEPGGEPFGGYSYLAGLYVLAPRDLSPLAEEMHALLTYSPHLLASASAPAFGLCVARLLAHDAPALYRGLNACRAAARSALGLPRPAREVW